MMPDIAIRVDNLDKMHRSGAWAARRSSNRAILHV